MNNVCTAKIGNKLLSYVLCHLNMPKVMTGARLRIRNLINLKVPKCEIFDPFFYINKSYMGR
jgi:hypothetical protein